MRVGGMVLGLVIAAGCGRSPVDYWAREGADGDAWDDDDEQNNGGAPQTCERVDFLFVIDNSESMANNQAKLTANFGAFLGGISDAIEPLESMHLGVITTDAYQHNTSGCRTAGALVTQTGGNQSSHRRCGPYTEGHRYMTDADDIEEAFTCAAQVGSQGSGLEQILQAPLLAISPPLTNPGECNSGFIRDDALLVLVVITDEDVDMDPVFAATQMLSVKRSQDIVTVALGNPTDGTCGLTGAAFGLETFVAQFRHGFMGPICGEDYGDVLSDAVDAVAAACPGVDD